MSIGKVIRYYRKKNGLTQKKLGGVFHSDSHVSDIERGLVFPSHKTLIDFSNILGVRLTKYLEYISSDNPIEVEAVVSDAIELVKNYKYGAANKLIQEFKSKDSYFDSYNGKLVEAKYSAIYYSREKNAHNEAISILLDAIDLSAKERYSYNELDIINNIGSLHFINLEFGEAKLKFEKCLSELNKLVVVEDKRLKSSILYNLSRVSIDLKKYDEVYDYSLQLIEYCIDNEYTYMLAKAYYNKGASEFFLGRESDAVESFKLTYYMFLGLNQMENAKRTLDYIKEHFNITL